MESCLKVLPPTLRNRASEYAINAACTAAAAEPANLHGIRSLACWKSDGRSWPGVYQANLQDVSAAEDPAHCYDSFHCGHYRYGGVVWRRCEDEAGDQQGILLPSLLLDSKKKKTLTYYATGSKNQERSNPDGEDCPSRRST